MNATTRFSGNSNKGLQVGSNAGVINYLRSDGDPSANESAFLQGLSNEYRQQKDINGKRVPETCEWFLGDPEFHKWRDADISCLLHVYAGPGCGKSVLAKCLIDERLVATSITTPILYFFFKNGQGEQDQCTSAIAAMLHQLYTQHLDTQMDSLAMTKYQQNGAKLFTMFNELWDIFVAAVLNMGKEIVCVLDALDECNQLGRGQLMDAISTFYSTPDSSQEGSAKLKFLVTSRPYRETDFDLGVLRGRANFVRFDGDDKSELVVKEINRVIEIKVPVTIPRVASKVQKAIIEHLQSMTHRTYLWLYLILDFVRQNLPGNGKTTALKSLIKQLPPSIDEAYQSMLTRSTDKQKAKNLLSIVVAARRPLTIAEAKVALELLGSEYKYMYEIEKESDEQFKYSVRELCGLLLAVHDSQLYFLHETAREFLVRKTDITKPNSFSWKQSIQIEAAEAVITEACVSFLSLGDFERLPPWADRTDRYEYRPQTDEYKSIASWKADRNILAKYRSWIDDHSFLAYAATYWPEHYHICQEQLHERLARPIWKILPGISESSETWLSIHPSARYHHGYRPGARYLHKYGSSARYHHEYRSSPLVFAATEGLHLIAQKLVNQWAGGNFRDRTYGTSLRAASGGRKRKMVLRRFSQGNVDLSSSDYDLALLETSERHYEQIVRLLLENEADANAAGSEELSTPLQEASAAGHEAIVRLLLKNQANVNAPDYYSGSSSALEAAASSGNERIVKLLLEHRADDVICGAKALLAASSKGYSEIVQLLLDHQADVDGRSAFDSPLHAASRTGHKNTKWLLLDHGAEINAQTNYYIGRALISASANGHERVLRFLIHRGADVSLEGKTYDNALLAASSKGHSEIAQLLINHGADMNMEGGGYGSALRAASKKGHQQIVQLLIDHGADVNTGSGMEGSALRAASMNGHQQIVQLLIDHGADVNMGGAMFGSALQEASRNCHQQIVQLLIDHGADVNMGGAMFGSALQVASRNGHQQIVQLLIDHGADVNTGSGMEGSALRAASMNGHQQIVQLLIDHGADVNMGGAMYGSALRAASIMGHKQIVQLLLNHGAKRTFPSGSHDSARYAIEAFDFGWDCESSDLDENMIESKDKVATSQVSGVPVSASQSENPAETMKETEQQRKGKRKRKS